MFLPQFFPPGAMAGTEAAPPEPISTDTGWTDAGGEQGGNWTNASNITAEDDSVATHPLDGDDNDPTPPIISSTYGFSLPAGATIDGIEVRTKAREDGVQGQFDDMILYWNGSFQGTEKAAGDTSSTLTFYTFGGASDTWGASPTKTDVERSDFGVQVAFGWNGGSGTMEVDCIQVKLYYTYTPA